VKSLTRDRPDDSDYDDHLFVLLVVSDGGDRMQLQLIHDRGGTFMFNVSARLTLRKTKNRKSSVLFSWFSGTQCTGTQQNR
jgi:hypothetical protein